jgi:hypothetical protein
MGIMSITYQYRDVVVTTAEFGSREFLIIDVTKDGYFGMEMKTRKRYPLKPDQIALKLGYVEEGDPILLLCQDVYDRDAAEAYCHMQARSFPKEAEKWKSLTKIKPGDILYVVHRKTKYAAVFIRVNLDKPLFPIRAKIKGLTHDFRLDSFLGLQPTKSEV